MQDGTFIFGCMNDPLSLMTPVFLFGLAFFAVVPQVCTSQKRFSTFTNLKKISISMQLEIDIAKRGKGGGDARASEL